MSEQRDKGSLLSWLNPEISRRKFLKISGALASVATAASFVKPNPAYALTTGQFPPDPLESNPDIEIKYGVCLMCHGACGIRAKIVDGVIVKIDGNPYHPNCLEPDERLPYATAVEDAREKLGAVCIKGQAGIQTIYNPYRLLGPIKRAPGAARGAGKWVSITWQQAIDEISAILTPYRDLTTLIDPATSELGPVANKVVFMPGRLQSGQSDFMDRFFKGQFGTINNRHDHTSICETSHHVAGHLTTDDAKNHFKPDLLNAQFIIYFGTNPLEAGFPMQAIARKTVQFKKNGGKLIVVDPRFSHTASKADQWIPIKPGTDAALALGMIRYIIANSRYDAHYLGNSNIAAALAGTPKEYTFTDATHLVRMDGSRAAAYLRGSEAGIGGASDYIILDETTGDPTALPDPKSASNPAQRGLLETPGGSILINGYTCKTAFTLLKEQANAKTIGEWASICGVSSTTIESLASEFTNYGKKAVASPYRGVCQHANGTYTMLCILALNTLLGNMDWKGGNSAGGGGWDGIKGGGKTGSVDLSKVPSGPSATGIQVNRVKSYYETNAPNIFARDGYPAQRPWFPHAKNGNFQEVLPSIADGYPYGIGVLITYWNDVVYTAPAARATFEAILANESLIPHHIAFSLEPDETSCWADYVLPDPSFLERWGIPGVPPTILTKTSNFREPMVGEVNPITGDYTPAIGDTMLLEDFFIAVAKKMSLPGIGAGAFLDGDKLDNAWDWYRKIRKNFSVDSGKTEVEISARGGIFDDETLAYEGNYLYRRYQGVIRFFIESVAKTKDSMTGQYFDGLPKYEPIKDAAGNEISDSPTQYPFTLVTYKTVNHTQSRTIVNPWLTQVIKPENFVEINASDAASLGIETGDMVKITSPSNPAGITGKAKATQGMRPGVAAICQSYGHWQLNSGPTNTIDGMLQDYDPNRGKGLQGNQLLRLDPALGNVCLQDKIGGSADFYNSRVKIQKI